MKIEFTSCQYTENCGTYCGKQATLWLENNKCGPEYRYGEYCDEHTKRIIQDFKERDEWDKEHSDWIEKCWKEQGLK